MAKIKSLRVTLPPSSSPDVVEYRLRITPNNIDPTYESEFISLGNDPTNIDIASLDGLADVDDVVNMGFSAVDDAGNESDLVMVRNVPLDFLAPNAPGTPVFSEG